MESTPESTVVDIQRVKYRNKERGSEGEATPYEPRFFCQDRFGRFFSLFFLYSKFFSQFFHLIVMVYTKCKL
jgi:hypothetical protein